MATRPKTVQGRAPASDLNDRFARLRAEVSVKTGGGPPSDEWRTVPAWADQLGLSRTTVERTLGKGLKTTPPRVIRKTFFNTETQRSSFFYLLVSA